MVELPDFKMRFEPLAIDHLGLRLYSTLPPAINELVSNAYDAEARSVEVLVPEGPINEQSEVVVRDTGHGMSAEDLANEYLPIGRCRRDAAIGPMSRNGIRKVTGRKGLGKLSAFGIAAEMEIRAVHGGRAVCLKLNYDEIKQWMKDNAGVDYRPTVMLDRSGPTDDADGVEVRLRKLRRNRPIKADDLRRGLARRLTVIGADFRVSVNGVPVGPGDRMLIDACAKGFAWDLTATPAGCVLPDTEYTLRGWIGFTAQASQSERGVDIFAHGKAVELGSYFRYASTHAQFARAHVIGEIHADFLDEGNDLIATARNSVVWESVLGGALERWGQELLRWAFDRWVELRKQGKTEQVIRAGGFDAWLSTRTESEQRVARRLVKLLVDDDSIEVSSTPPLLEIVKASVESVAFHDLVASMEAEGCTPKALLQLFAEWRVIEAREHLRIADGRLAAVDKLKDLMDSGALEVQELQPLFDSSPWLIDRRWKETDRQATYTKLLREKCAEPKGTSDEDLRLDIFAMSDGREITIVELKRPTKTVSRKDLEQIEKYVDWARANLIGTGEDAPKYARGLLVVGKLNADHQEKVRRLAGDDIRVQTFGDLHRQSREYYTHVEAALALAAPEYARERARRRRKDRGATKA